MEARAKFPSEKKMSAQIAANIKIGALTRALRLQIFETTKINITLFVKIKKIVLSLEN